MTASGFSTLKFYWKGNSTSVGTAQYFLVVVEGTFWLLIFGLLWKWLQSMTLEMFSSVCRHCKMWTSVEGCLRRNAVQTAVSDSSTGLVAGCCQTPPTCCQLCCCPPVQLWEAVTRRQSDPWLRRGSPGFASFSTSQTSPKVANVKLKTKYFQGVISVCF